MKVIEITYEQKHSLKEGVEQICEDVMALKDTIMDICDESKMGERDGDSWYIKQLERRGRMDEGRWGERRWGNQYGGGRMGHRETREDYYPRAMYRDPYYD